MSVYKYTLCLFLLLHCMLAPGQLPERYAFTHYGLRDGLASNIVNDLVQDRNGYIWLSTSNGLQRFDGNKFITFHHDPAQPASLPYDEVAHVYLDPQGTLWVITVDNKVGQFDTRTFRYRETPIRNWHSENVYVDKTFLSTADGRLLLFVKKTNKLFEWRPANQDFVPSEAVPIPAGWKVNHMMQDRKSHRFYLATDSGFVAYDGAKKQVAFHRINPFKDPLIAAFGKERFVNYLFFDARGRMFFEQWPKSEKHPKLQVYDPATGQHSKHQLHESFGLGYHQITALLQQQSGRLWVYGRPFLATYANSKQPIQFLKKDYSKEHDLKFNQVFSMFEDRQKNIWLCTDNGVYQFNPDAQLFHNYTLTIPERNTVEGRAQTALQWPNGNLWVGFRDLGIHCFDTHMQPMALPALLAAMVKGKSVWDLHLHKGKLWIALQGGQLVVMDTLSNRVQLLQPAPFEKRAITQIAEDGQGNLWFGNQAGNIVKWDQQLAKGDPAKGYVLVDKMGTIEKIFTDAKGNIWVAAVGEGLLKINPRENRMEARITSRKPAGYRLWNNNPKDIIQYNDSMLVVVSGALNLVNLNTLTVAHISTAQGLPTNTIQSVARDAAGNLWLGTLNGLCRADLSKLSFTAYNQSDGLLNELFNVAGAQVLSDGRMLFTSAESFVLFDPSRAALRDPIDKALLTDFKLMNRSLPVDSLQALQAVKLKYNQANVAMEFSALNFNQLTKLNYYYQLENFDSAWIKSDGRHQAIYTFLPPGQYRFKVKTRHLSGGYGAEKVFLTILVAPPFWKTWWFFLLLLALVVLVLFLIDRERVKRLAALYHVRSDIAMHLHQDVSTTLNNINVLSQIAKMKADKDLVRSKELIDEISGKSYHMMLNMDEILWSIDPGNDSMEKTVLRIYEFAENLRANTSVEIDIVVHDKVKDLQLDMKVRHDFFVLCKEALRTLAQHARGAHIMVDIDYVRSKICLKILCAGIDCNAEANGIHVLRRSMEAQASELHAHLNFETGKRDASIMLTVPVR